MKLSPFFTTPRLAIAIIATVAFNHCRHEGKLVSGTYAVNDAEFSHDNYSLKRELRPDGSFSESHVLDRCLLMEMNGSWRQSGANLTLNYSSLRQRSSCHDSMPGFKPDSANLKIPLRNVAADGFESFLTASEGKAEKWIHWSKEG